MINNFDDLPDTDSKLRDRRGLRGAAVSFEGNNGPAQQASSSLMSATMSPMQTSSPQASSLMAPVVETAASVNSQLAQSTTTILPKTSTPVQPEINNVIKTLTSVRNAVIRSQRSYSLADRPMR